MPILVTTMKMVLVSISCIPVKIKFLKMLNMFMYSEALTDSLDSVTITHYLIRMWGGSLDSAML